MIEITRINPFTCEETNETYEIDSLSDLETLPFVEQALNHGWIVYESEGFLYLEQKDLMMKVGAIRERKNGTRK